MIPTGAAEVDIAQAWWSTSDPRKFVASVLSSAAWHVVRVVAAGDIRLQHRCRICLGHSIFRDADDRFQTWPVDGDDESGIRAELSGATI